MSYIHLSHETPFPVVNDLGTFKTLVGEKEEIRYQEGEPGFTTAVYMVSMESTFDNAYARECRGIVFNAEGRVVSRPLHKFFNVNERAETQLGALPWDKVHRVMDKRDGSMIHTVEVGAARSPFPGCTYDIKSKKSFKSDVANDARKFMLDNEKYMRFCQDMTERGQTAIFEWTSPTARIVLPYSKEELKLLHVRDNVTGEYYSSVRLNTAASLDYGIPCVDDVLLPSEYDPTVTNYIYTTKTGVPFSFTLTKDRPLIDQFLELVETVEDTEGWIFQFANGDMVKLKTKEYIRKHRVMTFLRERDIAEMVVDEAIDDVKATLVSEGVNIAEILAIEKDVVTVIDLLISEVEDAYDDAKTLSKKDAALKYGPAGLKARFFGLLMKKMDGHEPDYKDYFKKNILKDRYDVNKQLNLLQSVAEAE